MAEAAATSRWTFDKLLILVASLLVVYAELKHTGWALNADFFQTLPFLVAGLVAVLVLVFYDPPWMFLVAGIVVAVLPALVLTVFASPAILASAGSAEYAGALALALGLVFALVGGIGGFVRARRGVRWAPMQGFGTSTGIVVVLVSVLAMGMGLSSGLARDHALASGAGGVEIDVPHATVQVVTQDLAFSPATITLKAGELTAIVIENKESVDHTFTYTSNGTQKSFAVPAGVKTTILVKFDTPGDVEFHCIPHAPGMKGTMHVA